MAEWKSLVCAFELKDAKKDGTTGTLEGFASVYGNVDQGGDVVERGAFTKTLSESGRRVPMLWQHDHSMPIGKIRLEDSEKGLMAYGELDLDIPEGQRAYSGLSKGYVKGLSIGYSTVRSKMRPDGVRQLLEVKLWEVSVVTFPMNELATVATTKSSDEDDVVSLLRAQTTRLTDAVHELRDKRHLTSLVKMNTVMVRRAIAEQQKGWSR